MEILLAALAWICVMLICAAGFELGRFMRSLKHYSKKEWL